MADRNVWFIRVTDESGSSGLGEVAPINRLSPEDVEEIPEVLVRVSKLLHGLEMPGQERAVYSMVDQLVGHQYPSVRFGLEMALMDMLNGGAKRIFNQDLSAISLPINGLIWMGDLDFMQEQIKDKLDQGFNCIKLKVGALDFDTELEVIKNLRKV